MDVLHIIFTVVLVLAFPIAEYLTKNAGWRRILFFVHIVCAIVFVAVTVLSVSSSNRLETRVLALQEYSSVAHLDAAGYSSLFTVGEGLTASSPLIETLKGTYTTIANGYEFRRDEQAEAVYLSVIEEHPKFPFTYYLYATCLHDRGAGGWREYAEEARRILELTTLVDGHHGQHDETLQKVEALLTDGESGRKEADPEALGWLVGVGLLLIGGAFAVVKVVEWRERQRGRGRSGD